MTHPLALPVVPADAAGDPGGRKHGAGPGVHLRYRRQQHMSLGPAAARAASASVAHARPRGPATMAKESP
ncbi:hypothetical protein CBM2637_A10062 [Cupriavidus taiwanensis]|nr:hypothetical protein CBM2637_A10062 [Cupriavidus taiwanensis]